ncbi:arylesterase [Methylobacillus flagellatus]|uniref:arylesterase n=1 Tax=Methylobacillus flagellatus TaxID=405 RepID=UPI0010F91D95|nr:arylesterase [Methylobacillus flagellatus]
MTFQFKNRFKRLHQRAALSLSRVVLVLLTAILGFGASAHAQTVLVFGDSLSAAYRMPVEQGWVALLQQRIKQRGFAHQVVNASVSGETTRGGLTRLPAALKAHQPSTVILELGANDGLRGLPMKDMEDNLRSMIRSSQQAGATVVLVGMRIPPNYGLRYSLDFMQTYSKLAMEFGLPLVPFMLEGIAGDRALNQADGIHPNAQAQGLILERIWPVLEPQLRKQSRKAALKSSQPSTRTTPAHHHTRLTGLGLPIPGHTDARHYHQAIFRIQQG